MQPSRRGDFLEGQSCFVGCWNAPMPCSSPSVSGTGTGEGHVPYLDPTPHQAPDRRPQVTVPTDEFLYGERGGNEDRSMAPFLARADVPAWRSAAVPSLSGRYAAAGGVGSERLAAFLPGRCRSGRRLRCSDRRSHPRLLRRCLAQDSGRRRGPLRSSCA